MVCNRIYGEASVLETEDALADLVVHEMKRQERVYLAYLRQARESGLPPDGCRWDYPCPWFVKAAKELLRRGLARRRWLVFGPLGITERGYHALSR